MLTTDYAPGMPIWVDLGVPDPQHAADFYGSLFGWEFQSAGPEAGGYGMLTLGGRIAAAVGPLMEPGASPSWTVYFHTQDADATAQAVTQAGGAIRAEPMDVMTAGRMAAFTDAGGAQFSVWQPGDTPGLGAVTEPNSLCWTELYATDPDASKAFYRSVFGWTYQDNPMGDEFVYTVIQPAGRGEEASQGGIMPLSEQMSTAGMTPRWQPYFEVVDCGAVVAKAAEGGGTVLMGPDEVPGVGRLAALVDPFGAPFSLITSAPASG